LAHAPLEFRSYNARAMNRFEELRALLDLEQIELNIFRGQNERGQPGRLFGGQVLSQALMAAGRTVERLPAHSLHGYFLRPGDPSVPVVYTVDRLRDGRSFVTRNVVAYQRGQAILNLSASFHQAEAGIEHQDTMPAAPDPESVPTWDQRMEQARERFPNWQERYERGAPPIDFRFVNLPVYLGGEPGPDPNLMWLRADGELVEGDALLHQCFITYATDMSMIDTIVRHHARPSSFLAGMSASLDHAVWFHRPFRANEWLLYAQDSPCAYGARGFARGAISTRAGVRVASVAQEGLVRRGASRR
jgi:acyl-CoA thioesterase-2